MSKSFNLESLIRPNIRALQPYRCARDDYDQGILLDANENAIGSVPPSPDALNRYPDPHQNVLRNKYAGFRGIRPEQVFCGVGSDEAIDLLIRIFCTPGRDSILITPPTYGMYKVCAAINDINVISAPLNKDFSLNTDLIFETIDENTKIIFLCSPNNPTANLLNRESVTKIIENFNGIVVIDEAYIDFSGDEGFSGKLDQYPNLVILQTLSKSFGLAGARLGVALASEQVIGFMLKVKAPYNVNTLTAKAAQNALDNLDIMKSFVRALNNERAWVISELTKIETVRKVHPTDANFVLVVIDNAYEVYKKMADSGVVIRFRGDQIHCENTIRITIGTHQENLSMIKRLKEVTS